MPHSGNGTVVSCAADGLVRVAHIPPGGGGAAVETRRLACHRGRAHKLALEPGSASCFLSCGEGGLGAAGPRAWGAWRVQGGRTGMPAVAQQGEPHGRHRLDAAPLPSRSPPAAPPPQTARCGTLTCGSPRAAPAACWPAAATVAAWS